MTASHSSANWKLFHAGVFFAFTVAASQVPQLRTWPWLWVAPFLGYACSVALIPPLRRMFTGWRFGIVTPRGIVATAVIAIGASAVLLAFDRFRRPDVSAYFSFLSVHTLGGILVAGVLFSLLNAVFEEIAFRGILFDAVESQIGSPGAIAVTATIFGFCHMQGYPPGTAGAILAGVFGLVLGWLRLFTGGLGLPVLAHIVADATIYTILVHRGIWN
jgi:uncharacterized protein